MPVWLADALATPGLWWLLTGAVLAGLVRGFSGFGTAMIFLPFASRVLDPVSCLVALIVMDVVGPLPLVRGALREASGRHLAALAAGMVICLPVGLLVLTRMEGDVFGLAVGCISLAALVPMAAGWRFRGVLTLPVLFGAGAAGGFLGGAVGLPGPPVILVTLASPMGPAAVRATTMLYLLICDLAILAVLTARGMMSATAIAVGAVAILPYMAGTRLGARIFDPAREPAYRRVAFVVIFFSALSALPIGGL